MRAINSPGNDLARRFAQTKAPPQQDHKEAVAAQEALERAMLHLGRVRGPHTPAQERAYELARRASAELVPLGEPGRIFPLN